MVVGGGFGGLVAARVLAEHFEHVVLVDRDALPAEPLPRRGAPQGAHVHVLLRAGELVLEELFPGLVQELERAGSTRVDAADDVRWFHHGVWKLQYRSGIATHFQSRPLLEALLGQRVRALGSVELRGGSEVRELVFGPRGPGAIGGDVTGVVLGGGETLPAELVVDASGRGSALPRWLAAGGHEAPAEERVGVELQYASRIVRLPPGQRDWSVLAVYPSAPRETRGGVIFPLENGTSLVTLLGYLGDHPPGDAAGFDAFAQSLARPELADALRAAEPLSDVRVHRFPYARWRKLDALRRPPGGLVALGDAVCSFDPVFGQGMTVAVQGARLLGRELARVGAGSSGRGDPRDSGRVDPRRFYRALRPLIAVPWLLATCEDYRYPQMSGPRPPGLALLQGYVRGVVLQTARSEAVHRRFTDVLHLLARPHALAHPAVALRVLLGLAAPARTRRQAASQTAP